MAKNDQDGPSLGDRLASLDAMNSESTGSAAAEPAPDPPTTEEFAEEFNELAQPEAGPKLPVNPWLTPPPDQPPGRGGPPPFGGPPPPAPYVPQHAPFPGPVPPPYEGQPYEQNSPNG